MVDSKNLKLIPDTDKYWWKIWSRRRTFLAFMAFLGTTNNYMQRMNMSIAIVAMTATREVADPETGLIEEISDFDWDSKQKNFVLSSFFIGYILSMLPVGILVKKVSPVLVFGLGVGLSSILTVLTPVLAQNYELLIASRIIAGIVQGVQVPCLLAFWKTWAPPLERATLHALAMNGCTFGMVITLPLSGVLGGYLGWKSIFYVTGGIGCLWYIVWLGLVRDNPETDPFISEFERKYIQKTVGNESGSENPVIPWRSILTSVPVWALFIAAFSWEWGFVTIATQLPSFFEDTFDIALGQNGAISSIPYITMTVFMFFAGFISDRVLIKGWLNITQARKCFISIALILQMIFILLFAHITQATANILLLTASVAFGAFTAAGFGVNYVDLGPAFASIVGALGNTLVTCAGIFSPILTGFIVQTQDKLEWRYVWYICAGIYLFGAIIYWSFGSGDVQKWAKGATSMNDSDLENNRIKLEMKNSNGI